MRKRTNCQRVCLPAAHAHSYEGNALEDPWDGPTKDMYTRSVSIEDVSG